jgi:hypothetical protein
MSDARTRRSRRFSIPSFLRYACAKATITSDAPGATLTDESALLDHENHRVTGPAIWYF